MDNLQKENTSKLTKISLIIVPIIFMLSILAIYFLVGYLRVNQKILSIDEYVVVSVLDGDTIKVEKDNQIETVRYIGIDTPEIEHNGNQSQCYGKEATDRNSKLVNGQVVELKKDKTDRDKYGRLLRYVYVNNEMINLKLVEEGYAYELYIPPNGKYSNLIKSKIKSAQENLRGVWLYCANEDNRAIIKVSS